MRKGIGLFTTVMVCMAMALCVSCKKDNAEPSGGNTGGGGTQTVATVTTEEVTEITKTTAVCGGEVESENGWAVTERGVCWNTEPNPTPSDSHTVDGEGVGAFTSEMTGLEPGTKYYVRAYAKNAAGTGFGAERSFTTLENGGGGGGRFSVSPTTTVEFAPGNLYYDGTDSKWKFEANQWSFEGTWNENHVSHFKWSDAANAVTDDWNHNGDLFCANNFTVTGDSHAWRTLSKDEWNYLLGYDPVLMEQTDDYGRPGAKNLCAWKELGSDIKGLVILPDGTDASVMSSISSTEALATHGAVFLPAAGSRYGTFVYLVGSYGFYWSSSPDGSNGAYYMDFISGNAGTSYNSRGSGYAVRLVR